LRRGEQISKRQAWRMIRRALRLTGRAGLGLEVGIRENLSHLGLAGLALGAARTLSDAIDLGQRYQNQVGGISSFSMEYGEDSVALTVESNLHDRSVLPFVIEENFASALALARLLIGDRFQVHMLEVAYPKPAYADRYRQIFGCPVHFGCTRHRAQFDRRWLDAPIATQSAVMAAQLGTLLEQKARTKALPPRSTVAVERLLLRSGNARLSIDQVANALQISVRTLRRRLSEDGSSFRALSERIRVAIAQRLLRERGMTVAAAAERLGFSDTRGFRRAFKRWLGKVPGNCARQLATERHAPPASKPPNQ
jgi:AraC-like DNA-binding protein